MVSDLVVEQPQYPEDLESPCLVYMAEFSASILIFYSYFCCSGFYLVLDSSTDDPDTEPGGDNIISITSLPWAALHNDVAEDVAINNFSNYYSRYVSSLVL